MLFAVDKYCIVLQRIGEWSTEQIEKLIAGRQSSLLKISENKILNYVDRQKRVDYCLSSGSGEYIGRSERMTIAVRWACQNTTIGTCV